MRCSFIVPVKGNCFGMKFSNLFQYGAPGIKRHAGIGEWFWDSREECDAGEAREVMMRRGNYILDKIVLPCNLSE
jgi:hypothetical protein